MGGGGREKIGAYVSETNKMVASVPRFGIGEEDTDFEPMNIKG
jgi:hypothetical protein